MAYSGTAKALKRWDCHLVLKYWNRICSTIARAWSLCRYLRALPKLIIMFSKDVVPSSILLYHKVWPVSGIRHSINALPYRRWIFPRVSKEYTMMLLVAASNWAHCISGESLSPSAWTETYLAAWVSRRSSMCHHQRWRNTRPSMVVRYMRWKTHGVTILWWSKGRSGRMTILCHYVPPNTIIIITTNWKVIPWLQVRTASRCTQTIGITIVLSDMRVVCSRKTKRCTVSIQGMMRQSCCMTSAVK